MAIFAALFSYLGQQAGKVLNLIFSWTTVALFGRVPQRMQLFLSVMALLALVWPILLVGVAVPAVATFLLGFVTLPAWADAYVRPAMLAAAVALPFVVGILSAVIQEPRPKGGALARTVVRGWPYTIGLMLALYWMAVVVPARKVISIAKRQEDAHVPIAVTPGKYDVVLGDLGAALGRGGLPVQRRRAGWAFEVPGRALAFFGGARVDALVPKRLYVLRGEGFEVAVHPMDLAIRGAKAQLARARSAIARELVFTEAHQTWTKEAQQVEDALRTAATTDAPLAPIEHRLATIALEQEEWEVLYRISQQVRARRLESVGRTEAASFRSRIARLPDVLRNADEPPVARVELYLVHFESPEHVRLDVRQIPLGRGIDADGMARQQARGGLVHATGWRHDGDRLVLTYLSVVDRLDGGRRLDLDELARLVRGMPRKTAERLPLEHFWDALGRYATMVSGKDAERAALPPDARAALARISAARR